MKTTHTRPAAFALALTILSVAASSAAATQAPWLIDIPDGARTIQLPAVPEAGRTAHVALTRDLMIEPRGADPNYLFYRPSSVVVDERGRMFVLDTGEHHIQVYDHTGEHVTTIGASGSGPGEFRGPSRMTIAAGRLVVTDAQQARVSIWTTDGDHLEDHLVDRSVGLGLYFGLADGSLLGKNNYLDWQERPADLLAASRDTVALFDGLGTMQREMAILPLVVPVALRRVGDGSMSYTRADIPQESSQFVATGEGLGYAAHTREYQVFAFRHDRGMTWALQVPWQRELLSEREKEEALRKIRDRRPDAQRSEIDFPDRKPALSRIATDAAGYLYVFPYADVERGEDRPVDVYSPQGERVLSGWIPEARWTVAHSDYVYAIEPNPATEERTVVRYRLQRSW